jgi:hypothetical protein
MISVDQRASGECRDSQLRTTRKCPLLVGNGRIRTATERRRERYVLVSSKGELTGSDAVGIMRNVKLTAYDGKGWVSFFSAPGFETCQAGQVLATSGS